MIKRLHCYFKEMYPIIPRLVLGAIIFAEIYFIILLNYGVTEFTIGISEIVGAFTIFSFLLMLRIADDFKDYDLDCRLFPQRPLPSGKVKKKDLKIFVTILIIITAILNLIFMNNIPFFIFLYVYGGLMAVWFFQKAKIQPNLMMALITHNPVQMIMNIYIISFTCIKYSLEPFTYITILTAFTLYFPALIWEVSRKIRAPKDETEYVTYSKLFGYKKAVKFVLFVTLIDIVTNMILIYNLNKIAIVILFLNLLWFVIDCIRFMKQPEKFKFVSKVERYTYITEITMIAVVVIYMIVGKI
ncbi:MAG: prenyltransferase [Clostridia bacterium]